ncbi:MAG: 4Fe-4S dicluster domain-containing protein [Traorella sp.]
MKTSDLYLKKELCCGCSACYAICPKQAIELILDEEGFEYPQIDEKKCVNCKRCIFVCPIKKRHLYNNNEY